MKQLQRICKALGNPRRLAILELLLRRRELSVGTIAASIRLSLTATSKHLSFLANVDLVEKRQENLMVYYRVASEPAGVVADVLKVVRKRR